MNIRLNLLIFLLIPVLSMAQYSEYEWEERDSWMPLQQIYELSEIVEGNKVADIGCHEGYLTIHLAKIIGDKGRVYAVDVREDRLELLKDHLASRDIENVSVIHGDYDNPKLPKNTLDVVVIMDTYHEMEDYMTILKHVNASLKTGGKIVIIEKLKSRIEGRSREAQVDAHSLGSKYVKRELKKAGFDVIHENNDIGNWENDEDKVMWIVVAEKRK
jgi:ubiquinone/menaquinone biosynthesis C-methylase UbiE